MIEHVAWYGVDSAVKSRQRDPTASGCDHPPASRSTSAHMLPESDIVRQCSAVCNLWQSMAIYGNLSNHSSEKPGKQPDLGTTNKQILVSFKHQDFSSNFTLSQIPRCSCHMPCRLSKHAAPRIHLPLPVDGGCLEAMLHGGSLGKFSKVFFWNIENTHRQKLSKTQKHIHVLKTSNIYETQMQAKEIIRNHKKTYDFSAMQHALNWKPTEKPMIFWPSCDSDLYIYTHLFIVSLSLRRVSEYPSLEKLRQTLEKL